MLVAGFVWLLLIEAGVEWWYRAHETNLVRTAQWTVQWPQSAPDFRDLRVDEGTRAILHYDDGRGATWRGGLGDDARPATAAFNDPRSLLYFFRWRPGHNSALLANAHRPDICLPASGWHQTGDNGTHYYQVSSNLAVPFRHFVFSHTTQGRTQFAHAFYCVWEDRVRPASLGNGSGGQAIADPGGAQATRTVSGDDSRGMEGAPSAWSRTERMEAVWQGRRHLGQQVMEYLIMYPREVSVTEAEEKFGHDVPRLIRALPRQD